MLVSLHQNSGWIRRVKELKLTTAQWPELYVCVCVAIFFTSCMGRLKALLLHRVVGEEADEQLVAAGGDGRWLLGAAEAAEGRGLGVAAVVNLDVVVRALQVSLHVDLVESLRGDRGVIIIRNERQRNSGDVSLFSEVD